MKTNTKNGAVIIGGDFQGLGIARNLAPIGIPVAIVDPNFCIGRFSKYVQRYFKSPPLTDINAFVDFLYKLAVQKKLEKWVIYPTSDRAVHIVAKYKDRLGEKYLIPTPKWPITKFAYDKKLTCKLAEQLGLPIPKTIFPDNKEELNQIAIDFPVILKPTVNVDFFPLTKQKALRANNKKELFRHYDYMSAIIEPSQIMVQEFITGGTNNLYSFCSLFSNGVVKAKIVARRKRQHPMDFGNATTYAITCEIPELEELATKFLRKMNYYGLSEVEFMFDDKDKKFKLLEINARTWGWHTLGAKAGVNFSSLLFKDINNVSIHANSFEKDVKWMRLLTDIPITISEMWKNRLKPTDYFKSIKGIKEFAVYSNKDPLPFVIEVLLAPYFLYKRGF